MSMTTAVERIPGWGVDADPDNDPTWPMRDQSRDDSRGANWTRPPLQTSDVEILQSNEHVRRPAVFGTSTPPRGLSGSIRRYAFRYSESQWMHWLLLMAADRINVMEGVVQDLRRGRVPNPIEEMGLKGSWKYDRDNTVKTAAVAAGAVVLTVLLVRALRR